MVNSFGIIGRNGSGKSTLVHLMTGAYEADPGGIREHQRNLHSLELRPWLQSAAFCPTKCNSERFHFGDATEGDPGEI